MGWATGTNQMGRDIGYAVEATCDFPGCNAEIDRGLAYVCGGMHDGGEHGCGDYFCYSHLLMGVGIPDQLCKQCCDLYEKHHPEEIAAEWEEHMHRTNEARRKVGKPPAYDIEETT